MIPAYEGKEPYIFISYAHKDSTVVFRLVEQLNERGYRIWYDEGIEPGSEWPEYIANHLLGAEMVLSVLTPNAVNSVNCRREINFALSRNKPVLTIYMEDIELPVGLELQLSSQQSVLYYTYDSEERFLDKIETCQHLRPCKRAAGESFRRFGFSESCRCICGAWSRFRAHGSFRNFFCCRQYFWFRAFFCRRQTCS